MRQYRCQYRCEITDTSKAGVVKFPCIGDVEDAVVLVRHEGFYVGPTGRPVLNAQQADRAGHHVSHGIQHYVVPPLTVHTLEGNKNVRS